VNLLFFSFLVQATFKGLLGVQTLPSATTLPVQEMKALNMMYVEQNAGDIMWIPAGLFHGVRNMTNTVALTYNILIPERFLHPDYPGITHLKFSGKFHLLQLCTCV
jgi:hypothetical protein